VTNGAAANDEHAFMNFHLMPCRLRLHQIANGSHYTSNKFEGHGNSNEKKPVMIADGDSALALLFAMAHEIGHNKLYGEKGLAHPRDIETDLPDMSPSGGSNRAFPLATLRDDQKRLMWGTIYCWGTSEERQRVKSECERNHRGLPLRINPKTGKPWAVLIKQEWDVLQGVSNDPYSHPEAND